MYNRIRFFLVAALFVGVAFFMTKSTGVSAQTVKNWLNGKCSPSYEMWETYFKQT